MTSNSVMRLCLIGALLQFGCVGGPVGHPGPGEDFEAPVGESAEEPATDPEADVPREGFEEPNAPIADPDQPGVDGRDELATVAEPRGGEAFVPKPGFEEPTGKLVEPPLDDPEIVRPRVGFEDPAQNPEPSSPSPQLRQSLSGVQRGNAPLEGRVQIEGRLRRIDAARFSIEIDKQESLSFDVLLMNRALLRLAEARTPVAVRAFGETTPVGRSEGFAISAAKRIEYLSERLEGARVFGADARGDLEVRPMTEVRRSPIFRGPCRATYEIPTEFGWGDESIQLSAGERGSLVMHGAQYTIALGRSRANVPAECDASFELPLYELQYVVIRD